MTQSEQNARFALELKSLIDRYAQEYELDAVAVLGIMRMQIRYIENDLIRRSESAE
jgi:hypothetical protein